MYNLLRSACQRSVEGSRACPVGFLRKTASWELTAAVPWPAVTPGVAHRKVPLGLNNDGGQVSDLIVHEHEHLCALPFSEQLVAEDALDQYFFDERINASFVAHLKQV